jgi:fructokinase
MNKLVESSSSQHAVCTGSGLIALDIIYEKLQKNPRFLAGGSCGNVLTILSYFGWRSYPISRLGNDQEGNRIIEDMKRWNVKTDFVERDSKIDSPRIIERIFEGKVPKHRFYLKCDHGNWLPHRKPFLLKSLETIQNKFPKSNVFYFDRASPSAFETAKLLKKQDTIIFFEPPKFIHGDDVFFKCLQISDVVKHCYDQSEDTEKSGISIPLEIQTMGEKGLRYKAKFLKHKTWKEMSAYPVHNLVDAAGSGDWLTAGLIQILFQHKSKHTPSEKRLEYALKFGQAMAALNCKYVGARGIMYNLSKQKLFNLVDQTIQNNTTPIEITHHSNRNNKMESRFASKCRVCLCTN